MTGEDDGDPAAIPVHFTPQQWAAIIAEQEARAARAAAESASDEDLTDLFAYACDRWVQLDSNNTFQTASADTLTPRANLLSVLVGSGLFPSWPCPCSPVLVGQ